VKIIRQLVSFALGVTVGICVHAILKFRPLYPVRAVVGASQVGTSQLRKTPRPPWVQQAKPSSARVPLRPNVPKQAERESHSVAQSQFPLQPKHKSLEARGTAPAKKRNAAAAISVLLPVPGLLGTGPQTALPPVNYSPVSTQFKTIGYVERTDGQLEALILQENQVQVVHLGDQIAGRFRVTRITPESVDAVDETTVPPDLKTPDGTNSETVATNATGRPLAPAVAAAAKGAAPQAVPQVIGLSSSVRKSPTPPSQAIESAAESLGFIEQGDGKVESIVADGDSVRLVPERPAETMAQVTPPVVQGAAAPAEVSKSSSSQELLAVGTMANAAERSGTLPNTAVWEVAFQLPAPAFTTADPSEQTPKKGMSDGRAGGKVPVADELSNAISRNSPAGPRDRIEKRPVELKPLGFVERTDGELAAILPRGDDGVDIVRQGDRFAGHYRALSVSSEAVEALDEPPKPAVPLTSAYRDEEPATFIFQTLGYVETQDGQRQAVVADGPQVYLVKEGDMFAGHYQVTSVDQLLVLAVRVSPIESGNEFRSGQTKPGGKSASNSLYGYLHFPSSVSASARNFHEVDASGSPTLMNLGVDLFSPSLAGFDGRPQFVTADNPKLGF
jgi:hypothetical protein